MPSGGSGEVATASMLTVAAQWGFPLLAYGVSPSYRVCGGTVSMVNIGLRAPTYP
jgi:hypothetical protein